MNYPRVLVMQDISCVGQCSMSVAHSIISAFGCETVMLPTAIFSTHTAFPSPYKIDLTDQTDALVNHWKEENITFDCFYVGYLGSQSLIEKAISIADSLLKQDGLLIVDPVMGDHGKLYKGFTNDYVSQIAQLCTKADYILPNITEASLLANTNYKEQYDSTYIETICSSINCRNIILTGVSYQKDHTGIFYHTTENQYYYTHPKLEKNYSGTGDIFASVIVASLAKGTDIKEAIQLACQTVIKSIEYTQDDPTHWYGTKFELSLPFILSKQK